MVSFSKVVRVRNWAISWANAACVLAVVCTSVAAWCLHGLHLARATFNGAGHVELIYPPGKGCASWNYSACEAELSNTAELAYCSNSVLPYDGVKLPCWTLSQSYANAGLSHYQGGARIPSRYENVEYALERDLSATDGRPGTVERLVSANSSYAAEVEQYWVLITHRGEVSRSGEFLRLFYDEHPGYFRNPLSKKWQQIQVASPEGDSASTSVGQSTRHAGRVRAPDRSRVVVSGNGRLHRSREDPAHASISDSLSQEPVPQGSTRYRGHHEGGTPTILKGDDGDMVQLRTLLTLANVSLDAYVHDHSWSPNETNRFCGIDLDVSIEYTNEEPWMGLRVTPWGSNVIKYQYDVGAVRNKNCLPWVPLTVPAVANVGDHRKYLVVAPITVNIRVSGNVYVWDLWKACLSLTFVFTILKAQQWALEAMLSHGTDWYEGRKYETVDRADPDTMQAEALPRRGHEHA